MSKPKQKVRDNRSRLLKTAVRLFARHGYHGVSVDAIVSACRINKRMVYHYFGSKDALYRECLLTVYQRLEAQELAIMENPGDPEAVLCEVIREYFAFHQRNPEFTRLLLWENLNNGRAIGGVKQLLSKHPALEGLRRVINLGVSQGKFRNDIEAEMLLIQIIGLSFIYHSNRYTLSQALSLDLATPEMRERGCEAAIRLVLDGLRRRT